MGVVMVLKLTEMFIEACRLRCEATKPELVEMLDEMMCLAGAATTLAMQETINATRQPPAPPEVEEEEDDPMAVL